jgi:uncharacterized protein
MKQHRLLVFFFLAYALTWLLMPLIRISPLLGLPGLLMPAAAAILVTVITDGKTALKDLLGRLVIWQVGLRWYILVLGLPLLISLLSNYIGMIITSSNQVQLSPISPLTGIVFFLVVGEELGWRGYALPKLLERQNGLSASLILGIFWAVWHLPTFFLPGLPQSGVPFLAYLLYVISLSVLFTWIYRHTQGSLLLATLFHGAIDSIGFTNPALNLQLRWWITAGVYVVAALIVVWFEGVQLKGMKLKETAEVVV